MKTTKKEYRLNIMKIYALEHVNLINFRDLYLHLNSYITPITKDEHGYKGGTKSKIAAVTTSELRSLLRRIPDYTRLNKDEWEFKGDENVMDREI